MSTEAVLFPRACAFSHQRLEGGQMFRRHVISISAAGLACLAFGAALAAKTGLRFENPTGMAPPVGAYSHVAIVPAGSELVVLAGQIGADPAGTLPTDPARQFRNALTNVLTALKAQGLGPEQIIKLNVWLAADLPLETSRAIRTELLGTAKPPATLAYVTRLARPDLLVEVEAWAARPPN
jgi:2-iminobutanoate/2-iminopropanoate deaminase